VKWEAPMVEENERVGHCCLDGTGFFTSDHHKRDVVRKVGIILFIVGTAGGAAAAVAPHVSWGVFLPFLAVALMGVIAVRRMGIEKGRRGVQVREHTDILGQL